MNDIAAFSYIFLPAKTSADQNGLIFRIRSKHCKLSPFRAVYIYFCQNPVHSTSEHRLWLSSLVITSTPMLPPANLGAASYHIRPSQLPYHNLGFQRIVHFQLLISISFCTLFITDFFFPFINNVLAVTSRFPTSDNSLSKVRDWFVLR